MGCWRLGPRRLVEFARLPAPRRRRLLAALRLLWFARVGLWTMSFKRLRDRLSAMERSREGQCPTVPLDELVWCIEAAARYVPAATCLARSMAAQVFLRRHGYDTTLRIGVARDRRGTLEAHAWVESDGRVVVGKVEDFQRYAPLPPVRAAAS